MPASVGQDLRHSKTIIEPEQGQLQILTSDPNETHVTTSNVNAAQDGHMPLYLEQNGIFCSMKDGLFSEFSKLQRKVSLITIYRRPS